MPDEGTAAEAEESLDKEPRGTSSQVWSRPVDRYTQMGNCMLNTTREAPAANLTPARKARIQRQCHCGGSGGNCPECNKKRQLQRYSTEGAQPATALPLVNEALRSPGRPLDVEGRAFFEPRFAHDFSQVRVHTGSRATESARAVGAQAYTVGSDVVFREGKYAPQTAEGKQLLAHELTHVVQQASALLFSKGISSPSDASEREADRVASNVATGLTASVKPIAGAARIQRQSDLALPMPPLGAPRHQYSLFPPGQEPHLHLDPWVQAYSLLDPDMIQRALLNVVLSGVPGPSLPGLQFPTMPPSTPAPIVPRGAGPATPRAGSVGDVLSALAAVPAVKAGINRLRDTATHQLRQGWQSLSTGGRAVTIGVSALIAGSTLAGILGNDSSRQFALHFIQGKHIPVPFVPGLSVQVNPIGPNQSVMLHLDLSSLARRLGM